MRLFSTLVSALALAGATFIAGCGREAGSTPADQQRAGGPGSRGLVLSASDVAIVGMGAVEDGIAITGMLRPVQTISVRARLEGDIQGVFAREGEAVRAGQLLARFEAIEQVSGQESARAERIAAEGELATAQWNLEQTRELHGAGAVAERDLRAAEQAVVTARARVAAARSREQTTGMSVRDTRVLAPAAAVVEQRLVEPGERVSRGAELFTLVRNETLELTAAVPERRATSIAPGQAVRFDAAGQRFEGRVARVSPTIDPATRSVTVYVQVPNPRGEIRGGTFASGIIISRTVTGAVLAPLAAIRQTAAREDFVYRLAGNEVENVSVNVGLVNESAGVVEVRSGLAAGDRVIVGNVGAVGAGMRVQIVGGDTAAANAGAATRPPPPAP